MRTINLAVAIICGALLSQVASADTQDWSNWSRRQIIEAWSPIAYEALQTMEVDRGTPFSDSELTEALHSPKFADTYRVALQAFCKQPESARNLACLPESQ
jgi:hypothetical protein